LLIVGEDPEPDGSLDILLTQTDPQPENNPHPTHDTDPAQISLHALMGHTIPQTLRVMGHIQQSPVVVLVDSGSTHNFIQDRVAKKLNLPTEPAAHEFKVLVGNGEELDCSLMCSQVKLQLGSHFFTIDFFILPLSGAEIVLGVQWLKTLGPVVTDYEKLTMRFQSGGKVIQLSGEPKTAPSESSLH
jgi:predicted aspartyl protease